MSPLAKWMYNKTSFLPSDISLRLINPFFLLGSVRNSHYHIRKYMHHSKDPTCQKYHAYLCACVWVRHLHTYFNCSSVKPLQAKERKSACDVFHLHCSCSRPYKYGMTLMTQLLFFAFQAIVISMEETARDAPTETVSQDIEL